MDVLDPYSNAVESESDKSVSGSESSEHGGLTDEQIESTIRLLSQVIESSPNDYQSRVQLIGLLRQHGDMENATLHRETLTELFPLGENIWLEWIEDEERLASTESEFVTTATYERIDTLFRKATKDYLSIDVYLKWADFIEKVMVESLEAQQTETSRDAPHVGFDEVRSFYEEVTKHTMGHLSRGGEIWERYRAFVDMMASCLPESEQVECVRLKRTLFHRELENPHLNVAKMFAETYMPWEEEIGGVQVPLNAGQTEQIKRSFEQSWMEVEARMSYEVDLQTLEEAYTDHHTPDYERLEGLRRYIQFETTHANPNPSRIICLYERTLAMYFLVIDIWQSYVQYLAKAPRSLSNSEILDSLIAVQERAIRNYPYTHHMWCQLMISLEKRKPLLEGPDALQVTRREITNLFEKALQGGLQSGAELILVYKQYLDYRVRSVDNWSDETQTASMIALLESARTYFDSYLPDQVFEIEKYWANVALVKLKSVEQARAVYELAVRRNPTSTHSWLCFAQFEESLLNMAPADLSYGASVNTIRGLFKRAFAAELDAPEMIWAVWLDFERIHGDLDSFSFANDKVEKKQRELAQKHAGSRQAAYSAAGLENEDAAHETTSRKRKQQQQQATRKERRAGADKKKQNNTAREMREPAAKKLAKGKNGEAVVSSASDGHNHDHDHHSRSKKPTPNFDPVTLHVSGIPASENLSAQTVAALFTPFGEVAEVRFPRNAMGQLKGFVFVQFKEPQASKDVRHAIKAEKRIFALDFEGQSHELRVTAAVSLRPSKPKPVAGVEEFKHTVFVSNLSPSTTQEGLENLIQKIGAPIPVAVRMPSDRKTGASRCIAYLDFDEEELVQKSADLLKEKFLDGRRIKAAPSAPTKERPMRPVVEDGAASSTTLGSLGGKAAQEAEKHAANASQSTRLVPRSVAMRQQPGGHQRMRMNLGAKASTAATISVPDPTSSSSQMDTS